METKKIDNNLALGQKIIKDHLTYIPQKPGIYRMVGHKDKVLYVGKAKNLRKRVVSYTLVEKLPNRLQRMVSETCKLEIVITQSEIEALLLEGNLIKKLQPPYNILLKDDKSFPYLLLSKDHTFSRIIKHRGPQTIKGDYFGPFACVQAVDEAILSLQRIFQIRNCSDSYFSQRSRPCLQYHIKRCSAPCVNKITTQEYQSSIEQAKNFLNGKDSLVQKNIAEKMQQASKELNFEQAAVYRDRIKLLTQIQSKQRINVSGIQDTDVIAITHMDGKACGQIFFFRHGRNLGTQSFNLTQGIESDISEHMEAFLIQFYSDKIPAPLVILSHAPIEFDLIKQSLEIKYEKKITWDVPTKKGIRQELIEHALYNANHSLQQQLNSTASMHKVFAQLQQTFNLPNTIQRIEVYDNSHISGSNAFGVIITANLEGFDKKSYRKFAIQDLNSTMNDFAMMREVVYRRLQHQEWALPDLFLIDGGIGQINAVKEIMRQLNVNLPVIGIAKGKQRNAGKERFFYYDNPPINLEEGSLLLYFLQNIRDEAHRFAIQTHRKSRKKNIYKSDLDQIPNIGSVRKKALLQHFGSARSIKIASINDLLEVEGINVKIAEQIYYYFNSSN